MPTLRWASALPDSLIVAPLGPFALLSSVPPTWVLIGIELLLALSLGLLLVGRWIVFASWSTAVFLLLSFGIAYSFGKVDHSILLVITPALLARAWSRSELRGDAAPSNFPLRLLALSVGVSFAFAGILKAAHGWLSGRAHAALGYILQFQETRPDSPLNDLLVQLSESRAWELLDWVVVILECGVLVAAFWWRGFRVAVALLAIFHLTVWITMGIQFGWNIIVYGAFVLWSRIPLPDAPRLREKLRSVNSTGSLILAGAVGVVGWGLSIWLAPAFERRAIPLIIAAAAVGTAYVVGLIVAATRALRPGRPRRAPRSAPR